MQRGAEQGSRLLAIPERLFTPCQREDAFTRRLASGVGNTPLAFQHLFAANRYFCGGEQTRERESVIQSEGASKASHSTGVGGTLPVLECRPELRSRRRGARAQCESAGGC